MTEVRRPSARSPASAHDAPAVEDEATGVAAPGPSLSVFDAVMITVGIVIGAGIFKTPSLVADIAGSAQLMLAAWLLGGVLSLFGALCYAELAAAFPHAGGEYHFVTRAYGRDASFLFGWARVTVITTGSIALLAFVLGDYLSRAIDLGPNSSAIYAAGTVTALTAVNLAGLRVSARAQNLLTALQVAGLVLVAAVAWIATPAPPTPVDAASIATRNVPEVLGLAMVFVLLTYGGWNEAAYLSAEIRGGPRSIVRALVVALVVITGAYLVFVLGALNALGLAGLAGSEAVGADVLLAAFGPPGGQIIGAIVGIATLTSINATLIVGARSNYALGRDWPALRALGHWNTQRNVPLAALLMQAAMSLALVLFGALQEDGFATMVEFTAPVFWLFFMLTGIAVFVLRRRAPDAPRPFRVPLYPLLPAVFVATCAYLLYSSVAYARSQDAVHVCLYVMAAGVVAWLAMRVLHSKGGPAAS